MRNKLKSILTVLIGTSVVISCSKEKSFEQNKDKNALGNNCKITAVIPLDSATRKGLGSYSIGFGANDLTTSLALYDSITQTMHFSAALSYVGDTIKITTGDYFIKDANGRVSEFYTRSVPGDNTSEAYIYKYYYDQSGFLAAKNWYVTSVSADIPVFTYTYTWQNGNLIKVTAAEATGAKRTALTAEITYNTSITPKNFMYVFPEADELGPFIFSVNLGTKSKNAPGNIVVKVYDETGAVSDTYNTAYTSYKTSSDGYILELFAKGDPVDGLLVSQGLITFKYLCD